MAWQRMGRAAIRHASAVRLRSKAEIRFGIAVERKVSMQAIMFLVVLMYAVMTDGIVARFGMAVWAIIGMVVMFFAWRSLEA